MAITPAKFDPASLASLFTAEQLARLPELSSPEGTAALLGAMSKKERKLTERAVPVLAQHIGTGSYAAIEKAGWESWLKTVGPRTFTGSFSTFHAHLWEWYWEITRKRKAKESLTDDELVFLAFWARSFGKSSNLEWAAIAEGALVGEGYVLYVSGTQALAEAHVGSIRDRIESEEIAKYYPHLADPLVGKHGNQWGWRQDFLRTKGGWAVRPVGLDVGVRGGKVGDLRPTLLLFDDIDDHRDSPHIVEQKEQTIARAILPTGTRETIVLFGQNLIHRNSVANRIRTRASSLLSRRIATDVIPAFRDLQIEFQQTAHGPRNIIVGGTPTWPDIDLIACQKFLDDSGLEAFMAEYQHDFTAFEQGRVIPEYDNHHVITWSQFEHIFKVRYIPETWRIELGHDVGFTTGHISAWTWIGTSAMSSPLPGKRFRYRGRTFIGVGVDDMAQQVVAAMYRKGQRTPSDRGEMAQMGRQYMSHEAKSERMTYNTKYGFNFYSCDSKKTAGIAQWRHYLRYDRSVQYPFGGDVQQPDGTWAIGCPGWFDVVDDDQIDMPRDDGGLRTHRRQTTDWKWKPTQLSDAGLSADEPVKADEDTNDSTRMITATWGPTATPLTHEEAVAAAVPVKYRYETMVADGPLTPAKEMSLNFQRAQARQKVQQTAMVTFGEDGMPITENADDETMAAIW